MAKKIELAFAFGINLLNTIVALTTFVDKIRYVSDSIVKVLYL